MELESFFFMILSSGKWFWQVVHFQSNCSIFLHYKYPADILKICIFKLNYIIGRQIWCVKSFRRSGSKQSRSIIYKNGSSQRSFGDGTLRVPIRKSTLISKHTHIYGLIWTYRTYCILYYISSYAGWQKRKHVVGLKAMMANVDYTRLMWITIINNNITGPNVLPILCCEPIQKGW